MPCELLAAIAVAAHLLGTLIVTLLARRAASYRARTRLSVTCREAQRRLSVASDSYIDAVARAMNRRD